MTKAIEKGTMVEVCTTNRGKARGHLAERWVESYGVVLEELPRPISGHRVARVRALHPHEVEEMARLRDEIENGTYTDADGCRRWNMGNAVPSWSFEEAGLEMTAAERAAYDRDVRRSIEGYKEARANRTPEERAEEEYEMRAAFGPGEEVVNILTGERTRT